MMPLNDPRWLQLTTFFGDPGDLPTVLADWLMSVGSDQEETVYARNLYDFFLHQGTITNAAYAVAPWLVDVCKNHPTNCRSLYLADVALVEANRLRNGVHYNRPSTEETPDWLMSDYRMAIAESQNLIEDAIESETDRDLRHELKRLKPALFGNAEKVWSR